MPVASSRPECDLRHIQASFCIKYGNPAIYKKTYARSIEVGGEGWPAVLEKARKIDPAGREYRSADIPVTLVRGLHDKKGEVIAHEGQVLGHSPATTSWSNFVKFMKALKEQGLTQMPVQVTLGYGPMTNPKANKWGVVTFELLGAAA